jgi:hypothetical protein
MIAAARPMRDDVSIDRNRPSKAGPKGELRLSFFF